MAVLQSLERHVDTMQQTLRQLCTDIDNLKRRRNGDASTQGRNAAPARSTRAPRRCFDCGDPSHIRRSCPVRRMTTERRQCFACGDIGHLRRDCPHTSRQGGRPFCFRCGRNDHWLTHCSSSMPFATGGPPACTVNKQALTNLGTDSSRMREGQCKALRREITLSDHGNFKLSPQSLRDEADQGVPAARGRAASVSVAVQTDNESRVRQAKYAMAAFVNLLSCIWSAIVLILSRADMSTNCAGSALVRSAVGVITGEGPPPQPVPVHGGTPTPRGGGGKVSAPCAEKVQSSVTKEAHDRTPSVTRAAAKATRGHDTVRRENRHLQSDKGWVKDFQVATGGKPKLRPHCGGPGTKLGHL